MKKSYTIPCASPFRQAALKLAERRGVNVADLVRSVLLALPREQVEGYPDPGDPAATDREVVTLKSGPAAGRPWRRKPRLQVRMTPGYTVPMLRKALAIALDLDRGAVQVELREAGKQAAPSAAHVEELERLRAMVAALAFDPLPQGVSGRAEALHVLGFPPSARPDKTELRARFRILATIHHPDGDFGNHDRMAQLNEAMNYLRRYVV
ncbi:J domain-containing protein [Magnetospira thiophila]